MNESLHQIVIIGILAAIAYFYFNKSNGNNLLAPVTTTSDSGAWYLSYNVPNARPIDPLPSEYAGYNSGCDTCNLFSLSNNGQL